MSEIICLRKRNLILDFRRKSLIKSGSKIKIENNYVTTVPSAFPPDFHIFRSSGRSLITYLISLWVMTKG